MHTRQAKFKTSADLLLDNQLDEYLKKHVINVKPIENVNKAVNMERFIRLNDKDPKQRRVNATLNKVEDIIAKEKICYGH